MALSFLSLILEGDMQAHIHTTRPYATLHTVSSLTLSIALSRDAIEREREREKERERKGEREREGHTVCHYL